MIRKYLSLALLGVLCSVSFFAFAQDAPAPGEDGGVLAALIGMLPLILAAVVPPIVKVLRSTVASAIPGTWLPVVIPLAAALVTGVANLFGLDIGMSTTQLEGATVPVWESALTGLLIGLGGVGIHQIKRQTVDKPKA